MGFCISLFLITLGTSVFSRNLVQEKKLGWQHFLMMGFNSKTGGSYTYDDCEYSLSFETNAERNRANLSLAKERIKAMSDEGRLTVFLRNKILADFGDGTFSWGFEGNFYSADLDVHKNIVSEIYCSSLYAYWECIAHAIWLAVLFGCVFAVFIHFDFHGYVMALSLIGLVMFEILFEVRARYLFTYLPVFLLMSILGYSKIFNFIRKKLHKSER